MHECNIIIEKVLYFIDEAESPGNLELQNGTADLDGFPLVLFFDLEGEVLLTHQGSELGVVVQDEKLVVLGFYVGMFPRYRYVRYSYLALVAPAQLDAGLGGVLQDHDALLLLAGPLEDEVGPLGPVQRDQFPVVEIAVLSPHLDEARKLRLADLTLEFGEVVVLGASYNLLLDLDPDPLGQAGVVDGPTRSIALAGIEEEVFSLVSVVQTYFALVLLLRWNRLAFQHVLVKVRSALGHRPRDLPVAVRVLSHEVLDPAEFEGHAGSWVRGEVLRG